MGKGYGDRLWGKVMGKGYGERSAATNFPKDVGIVAETEWQNTIAQRPQQETKRIKQIQKVT